MISISSHLIASLHDQLSRGQSETKLNERKGKEEKEAVISETFTEGRGDGGRILHEGTKSHSWQE